MGNVEKKNFLFKFVATNLRNQLLFDEEALYSTTDQNTANKIAKEIGKYIDPKSTIVDATACIGGSSYALSQIFNKVYAIEINENRYNYLISNIKLLEVNNIECILGDALEKVKDIECDCIFIDPPWGGPEYKILAKVKLELSNKPLHDICKEFAKNTKFIVIKVPLNFDEEDFIENTKDKLVLKTKAPLRKMNLLIFEVI